MKWLNVVMSFPVSKQMEYNGIANLYDKQLCLNLYRNLPLYISWGSQIANSRPFLMCLMHNQIFIISKMCTLGLF